MLKCSSQRTIIVESPDVQFGHERKQSLILTFRVTFDEDKLNVIGGTQYLPINKYANNEESVSYGKQDEVCVSSSWNIGSDVRTNAHILRVKHNTAPCSIQCTLGTVNRTIV